MFNDAHLPDTDAWAAMTRDLRQSKESRNALSKENSYVPEIQSPAQHEMRANSLSFLRQLKRRLAELESEKEEYVPPTFLSRCHSASNIAMTGGEQFYADMA